MIGFRILQRGTSTWMLRVALLSGLVALSSGWVFTKKSSLSSSSSSIAINNRDTSENRIGRGRKIRRHERVVFFPTSAYYRNDQQQWIVPIHGWIFDQERRFSRRSLVNLLQSAFPPAAAARQHPPENEDPPESPVLVDEDREWQLLLEATTADNNNNNNNNNNNAVSPEETKRAKSILKRRVQPFVVDNHRRRTITIRLLGTSSSSSSSSSNEDEDDCIVREIPERSRKNGHFEANVVFDKQEMDQILLRAAVLSDQNPPPDATRDGITMLRYEAITGIENDTRSFVGTSQLIAPGSGLSVISDIDDTVKISDVLDKKKLLRHTFLEEFQAVPGMPELYQSWKQKYKASFHYVSSSPWQLYEELADFLERTGFPFASLHLKSIRLKDRTILNLLADPAQSKISKISSIIDTYPRRKFILVGDTGERDPEVYGEICRRYPHHIQRVLLRDVTSCLGDDLVAHVNRKHAKRQTGIVVNDPNRYTTAFYGVPSSVWTIFQDATEIEI